MAKRFSYKVFGKKKVFALTAVVVLIAVTAAVLSACTVAGAPPMADETYFGGYNTEPAFDGYYSAQVNDVLNSTSLDDATKAAYLWALASYNWGQTSQYAMFQNKVGDTVLNGDKGTMAYQQYHKEKRADGDYKGEKYHYTIKHIYNSSFSGLVGSIIEGSLESARLRFVANTGELSGLYRFELNGDGKEVTTFTGTQLLGEDLLTTQWKKGKDFGGNGEEIHKSGIVAENGKSLDEVIAAIKNDIQTCNVDDRLIQGNINTLADGVVSGATIEKATDGDYYKITMMFNLEKLNADERSIEFLKSDNSASEIVWERIGISFELWSCGLFKSYTVDEAWNGRVMSFSGMAQAVNNVYFSYSDADCSMDKELEYLTDYIKSGAADGE